MEFFMSEHMTVERVENGIAYVSVARALSVLTCCKKASFLESLPGVLVGKAASSVRLSSFGRDLTFGRFDSAIPAILAAFRGEGFEPLTPVL
jgi:hypothetical protein